MRLLVCCGLVLVSVLGWVDCAEDNFTVLMRTLDALTRALEYMHKRVREINLDAVFCVRKTQEQLQSYLINQPELFVGVRHWLEVLRDKAKEIADEGMRNVYITQPSYAQIFGLMINESKKLAWYPSQETSVEYAVDPVNCSAYIYDVPMHNYCYYHLIGGEGKDCNVRPSCYKHNEKYHQRDYDLTHQVLFWQAMEAHNCVGEIPEERRKHLCSNVMRDVKRTAAAHFPVTHADLFMEQVGLCGFWGFRDFNQPEWLEQILEPQHDSGCYKNDKERFYSCFDEKPEKIIKRVKRTEQRLQDGCYSHYTGVAITALVVNVRFEAEKLHKQGTETEYIQPNTLLS